MKVLTRWACLSVLMGGSAYAALVAFQNADFSVPVSPIASETYKDRAEIFFVISVVLLVAGIVFIIWSRRKA
jgi:hypothetical protein